MVGSGAKNPGSRLLCALPSRFCKCVASRADGAWTSGCPGLAFLRGIRAYFLAAHHKIHEVIPVLEKPIGGQCLQVLKELAAGSHRGADQLITFVTDFQQRVKGESQQVHRHQQTGQVLLAVTEVVFEVIALGLEGVVVLVFAPRPGSGSGCCW